MQKLEGAVEPSPLHREAELMSYINKHIAIANPAHKGLPIIKYSSVYDGKLIHLQCCLSLCTCMNRVTAAAPWTAIYGYGIEAQVD